MRILAWQVGNELLPTNLKLVNINLAIDKMCPRCNMSEESVLHEVRDCQKVRNIWKVDSIDGRLLDKP